MGGSRGRVTLQTIADAVGVSRTTVSNAYSRPDQLAPELRKRILRAADELGYAGPDAVARTLRKGRAGVIGLLFTETLGYMLSDPFAVSFLHGLAETAEEHDVSVLLTSLRQDPPDVTAANAIVDGFCLYCVSDDTAALHAIRRRRLPVVQTRMTSDPEISYVAIDDRAAARTAAEHLIALGHRRLGVLADDWPPPGHVGPLDPAAVEAAAACDTRDRLLGYLDAARAAGLDHERIQVAHAAANSVDEGAAMALRLLDAARPTGVLAVTDMLALGTLAALAERGLVAGERVSVVGIDDVPAAAAAGLTTIRQPGREKGRIAGRLLLEPPDDPAARRVVLPTELIARGSSGPPCRPPEED
jgi:DNA-binding LacI/PurR family transcriptional regulator